MFCVPVLVKLAFMIFFFCPKGVKISKIVCLFVFVLRAHAIFLLALILAAILAVSTHRLQTWFVSAFSVFRVD